MPTFVSSNQMAKPNGRIQPKRQDITPRAASKVLKRKGSSTDFQREIAKIFQKEPKTEIKTG